MLERKQIPIVVCLNFEIVSGSLNSPHHAFCAQCGSAFLWLGEFIEHTHCQALNEVLLPVVSEKCRWQNLFCPVTDFFSSLTE